MRWICTQGFNQKHVIIHYETQLFHALFHLQIFHQSQFAGLRDCSHKNQFLLGQFAQTEFFYWDDSPGTIRTNAKKGGMRSF